MGLWKEKHLEEGVAITRGKEDGEIGPREPVEVLGSLDVHTPERLHPPDWCVCGRRWGGEGSK